MMSLWYDFWSWVGVTQVPAVLSLSDGTPVLLSLFDTTTSLTLSDAALDTMGLTDQ